MATKKQKTSRSLDIDSAFKFVFKDKEWRNRLAVGGLLILTIIGGLAVLGWGLEILERVLNGKKVTPLPDWEPLGKYFSRGFRFWVVNFVWSLPLGLIYVFFFVPFFMLVNSDNPEAVVEQMQIWTLAMQPISFFMMFYIMIVQPVIAGIFVKTNSMIDALNIGYAMRMFRANWKQFLGVALLAYAASYAASLVGFALLCVGLLFTTPAAMAIAYHLYGQAYRNALAKAK